MHAPSASTATSTRTATTNRDADVVKTDCGYRHRDASTRLRRSELRIAQIYPLGVLAHPRFERYGYLTKYPQGV